MATPKLPTVLENIVAGRRNHLPEIRARIAHVNPADLMPSSRSLYLSLGGGEVDPHKRKAHNRFIMECKSASPSLGLIREHYRPGAIARVYSNYAAGISVLCEPDYFRGDYDHLATVAASTHLPVLCKDFIIDLVQIHAARYFGADAVLLMLSILSDEEYRVLADEAERLNLDVLTEAISSEEISRAVALGAKIIGVNHRNLHDLSIDLSRSKTLTANLPDDVVVVSESGIRDTETVRKLGGHSDAFLVGSQLTSQPDVDLAARTLIYGPNKVCGITSAAVAQAAKANGAVYGGLIFEETSPRNVSRETSREIIAAEPGLRWVAVSRREEHWKELVVDGVEVLQIHSSSRGSVEAEISFIEGIIEEVGEGLEIWRAISMTDDPETSAHIASQLLASGKVSRIVLDAGYGGSGQTFAWQAIPEEIKDRCLLAGGLGPKNINAALEVGCVGLDLNSGLEYPSSAGEYKGHKDAALLAQAFQAIRHFSYKQPKS